MFGGCAAVGCDRKAIGPNGFCGEHFVDWYEEGNPVTVRADMPGVVLRSGPTPPPRGEA